MKYSDENALIWSGKCAGITYNIDIASLEYTFCPWERKNDENRKALEQHHQSGRKYDERSVKSVNRRFLSNEDVSNEKSTTANFNSFEVFQISK